MTSLQQMLEDEGKVLVDRARAAAEHGWGAMDPRHKADVERAARRVADLIRRQFAGEDVRRDVAVLRATLLNYGWDGAVGVLGPIGKALLEGLGEAAARVGSALVQGLVAEVMR